MTSKHQQIIRYIESLPVGEKISVRSIAKNMEMSEWRNFSPNVA